MRKAITMIVVLALGVSLWADSAQTKPSKGDKVTNKRFPTHITTNDRTESYTIVMADFYGDSWNGASVDVLVNGTVVIDDGTVPDEYYEVTDNFDVEVGDVVTTVWTAGSYDDECSYGIYNPAGVLVAQAGNEVNPELEVSFTVSPTHVAVWISEYAEGTSNNKYLEIYNGTDASLDLTTMAFPNANNGADVEGEPDYWNSFPAGATVAAGDVYVIAHSSADATILAEADHTHDYLSNGDDGYCVVLGDETNFTILDCVGDWGTEDPGAGWDVAGVTNATADHTLVRNSDVTWGNMGDWASSAGTSADDSEWTVLDVDTWTNLGSHTVGGGDCADTEVTINMYDSYGDGWNGNVLTIGDESFGLESGAEGTATACLVDGNYTVTCGGGSWQAEVSWEILDAAGTVLLSGGAPYEGVLTIGTSDDVFGCTDPEAINYNPDATFDDGSCYYNGDSCSVALDFVTAGGTLDGTTAVEGSIESLGNVWYTMTLDQDWENLTVSLIGSDFDTQLEVWGACTDAAYIAFNDDYDGVQSQIDLFDVTAGTYNVRVLGWSSSFGNYVLTVNAFQNPTNPTGLAALGGLERAYLSWNPAEPSGTSAPSFDGTIDEHIQWQIDNKKPGVDPVLGARGITREMFLERHQNSGTQTRDTEVMITLFDSFGDGHYGGDSDGDAYVVAADGTVLDTLEGPWEGTENSYGPWTLPDGVYSVEWDATAPWLSEQTMQVTDMDGNVLGEGAAPSACFFLGEGYACGAPDLTVTDMSYDSWTGRATVTVKNIGDLDAGYFYTMAFLQDPDTTQTYPPGYFQYAWQGLGLAAGDSVVQYLSSYLTLPGFTGGYDGETYTLYAMADGYGNYVLEESEGNNVMSMSVDNTSPLANSTWNVWRGADGADLAVIENVSSPSWQPGNLILYTDEPLTADVEYCYAVTQVDGTTESAASNTACATPSAPPDVPEPTNLVGSSSGFDVTLTWDAPEPYEGAPITGHGTPSSTRQGGDTIEDATVITELEQLTGTTSGYTDDYDAVCPYAGATAPDVVYSFTPTTDVAVNITTCYSTYDTKIYVFENAADNLATTVTGADACSDDAYPPGVDDCTIWTSYIEGVYMAAGNTYYIVMDGYGAGEGEYTIDLEPYNPLAGYTVWTVDAAGTPSPIGQAAADATEWATVLFAAEPTDISLAITATYNIPGIFDPVVSDVVGPVTVTVQIEDNPNNLTAMDYGDDVHLMWDPPIDASNMELAYDDGVVANAWWYAGAVAVRFRVNGTYSINGLANSVWTGGWPDAVLGEQPYTLSLLAVDSDTDLPGDTLYQEAVLVDADPTSETYGWAMTDSLSTVPVTVTGDVFVMYSDFGYDFENNAPGADMDMMGCDAVLDFPGNKYDYNVSVAETWALSADYGSLACGDWILHMFADFTAGGDVASFGNDGVWINQSGASSAVDLPAPIASMEAVNTKDNPSVLMNPPVVDPKWAHESASRDLMHYNIYRDGAHVGMQEHDMHDYWDNGLDWGTYEYHVTAEYSDGHESMATNTVTVTLSNVPPDASMLISPGDGFEVAVTADNLDEEVAFIWTAAIDADNDPVEYYVEFEAAVPGDTLYQILPENAVENESFEDLDADGGLEGWESNGDDYAVINTGDEIADGVLFEAADGDAALAMAVSSAGGLNAVYQQWPVDMLPAGTHFWVDSWAMHSSADPINDGMLAVGAAFMDADGNTMEFQLGEPMTSADSADVWNYIYAECHVPEGATQVMVGVMRMPAEAGGTEGGHVFADEVYMHVPLTATGVFVTHEDIASAAIDLGLEEMTWTWDVWTSDGFEMTPSSSGPRELVVTVDADLVGIDGGTLPQEFALHNNYPNPFNPVTNILYDIPEVSDVTLEIYNVMGQRVRTLVQGSHQPGRYQIVWNATNDLGQALSSGMYVYRIQAGDFVSVKKLVLMK